MFKIFRRLINSITHSYAVSRKFVETHNLEDYEILTDTGWKDAVSIHKTIVYDIWKIKTTRHLLKCADNHIVFTSDMMEIFVKDVKPGQYIMTENGPEQVIYVYNTKESDNMYDIELSDDSDHRYYTDGILSHNTTSYTIFCLWYAIFFKDKKIMICANKLQTSIEIIGRIQRAYEYLPKFLKPGVVVYNKSEIAFSNGSVIKGFATGSSSSRGFSGNCVILDEMAFVPPNVMSDFFASVMPVISSGKNSKAIIVSTPNGTNNLYYDIWKQANSKDKKTNEQGWKPFRIDWWEAGGIRDEKWKQKQIATIGIQRWNQEFGNEFLESSTIKKLIPDDVIERFRRSYTERKAQNIGQGKDLAIFSQDGKKTYTFRMYHEFDPSRTYLASSDIAEGIGKDASVLYVWDITDTSHIKMCCKFSENNVSVLEFAYITNEILKMYNKPFLSCESNGISLGYIEQLRVVYNYDNFVRLNHDNGCGIQSHVQVKGRAALWLRDMMTTVGFGFEINDLALIDEMSTFIKKDTAKVHTVYSALGDNHDDHIMAMIWACWILNPENLEHYYVPIDFFTSSLGNEYARNIQSLFEYSNKEVYEIMNIPQVKEFRTYKMLHKEEFDRLHQMNQKEAMEQLELLKQNTIIEDNRNNMSLHEGIQVFSPDDYTDMMRRMPEKYDSRSGFNFSVGLDGVGGMAGLYRERPTVKRNRMYDDIFGSDDDESYGEW